MKKVPLCALRTSIGQDNSKIPPNKIKTRSIEYLDAPIFDTNPTSEHYEILNIDNINKIEQRMGSPKIQVSIDGHITIGVLDCGCSCTCMTDSKAKELFGPLVHTKIQPTIASLAGADQSHFKTIGEISVNLEIGGKKTKKDIVVFQPKQRRSVLLVGNDILLDKFAIMGGRYLCPLTKKGHCSSIKVPIMYSPTKQSLIVTRNYVIKSQQRQLVHCFIDSDDNEDWSGHNVLVDTSSRHINPLLSVPEIITKVLPGQDVVLPIENCTDEDILVEQNSKVGEVTIVVQPNEAQNIAHDDVFEVISDKFTSNKDWIQFIDKYHNPSDDSALETDQTEGMIPIGSLFGNKWPDEEGNREIIEGSQTGQIPPPPGFSGLENKKVNFEQDLQLDHLTQPQQRQIKKLLLQSYAGIISQCENDIGTTKLITHKIDVGQSKPVAVPYRPVPYHYRDEVDKLLKQLLQVGAIGYAQECPWSTNLVIVKKRDDSTKIRICQDFRLVNELSQNINKWPITNIETSFSKLSRAGFITQLDLVSAYWTILMDKKSSPITGFFGPDGTHYQWLRMPFGLAGAPHTFCQVMSQILRGTETYCFYYFDDVIIFSEDFTSHLVHLEDILKRFFEAGFKIKLSKCHFAQTRDMPLTWLGSVIRNGEVYPAESKVTAIKQLPEPRSAKQLLSFLGAVSFHRKHIPQFSTITACLFDLTKPSNEFVWEKRHTEAFEKIKNALVTAPGLALPDPTRPFIVTCDASGIAVGACLSQVDKDGERKVCAYASRKLNDMEKLHMSMPEKELLAILYACKTWVYYLTNVRFTIETDARSLIFCKKYNGLNSKISRIALWLSEFDFDIQHVSAKRGNLMKSADYLSRTNEDEIMEKVSYKGLRNPQLNRLPDIPNKLYSLDEFDKFANDYLKRNPITEQVDFVSMPHLNLSSSLASSSNFRPIINVTTEPLKETSFSQTHFIQTVTLLVSELTIKTFHKLQQQDTFIKKLENFDLPKPFFKKNNLVMRKGDYCEQIVVPKALHEFLIRKYHSSQGAGHIGPVKLFKTMSRYYFWPKMENDIRQFTRSCVICQYAKPSIYGSVGTTLTHTPTRPNMHIAMDVITALPRSREGHNTIVTFIDCFSKFCVAVPLKNKESKGIVKAFMSYWVPLMGLPQAILSDQGETDSSLVNNFCIMLGIDKLRTASHSLGKLD